MAEHDVGDQQNDVFTWAIHYTGDLDVGAMAYCADPARVALGHVGNHVVAYQVTEVSEVDVTTAV